MGEILNSGIQLTDPWPPRSGSLSSLKPAVPPYLKTKPSLITLDSHRQLFVDDFLVQHTTLKRTHHLAQKYEGNPIFKPETDIENTGARYRDSTGYSPPFACTFDDGIFFDPADNLFKMWYSAGSGTYTSLAYSDNGLQWYRPEFDIVPHTNVILKHTTGSYRDSFSPWLDLSDCSGDERFKGFLYTTGHTSDLGPPLSPRKGLYKDQGWLLTSPDGIHWNKRSRLRSKIGDNTLLFYNPFRARWCLSIRHSSSKGLGRVRNYLESKNFLDLAQFCDDDQVYWSGVDELDKPEPGIDLPPQLYGISASPYESLMIGIFTLHYGPPNDICLIEGYPKLSELQIAYSRDGFHWSRPERTAFIPASRQENDSERGYLRSTGGCCAIVGDRLYFYYSAFSGVAADNRKHMYAGGSTNVAFLRRDGFVSLNANSKEGQLLSRPVTFKGKNMFVNVANTTGYLTVEILDPMGKIIQPFSSMNCVPIATDSTNVQVKWRGIKDLSSLVDHEVRLRFRLMNGSFYSFWIQ